MYDVVCTTPLPYVLVPTTTPISFSCMAAASISLADAEFSFTITATGTPMALPLPLYTVSSVESVGPTLTMRMPLPSSISPTLTTISSEPPGLLRRSITSDFMLRLLRSFIAFSNSSAQLPVNMLT